MQSGNVEGWTSERNAESTVIRALFRTECAPVVGLKANLAAKDAAIKRVVQALRSTLGSSITGSLILHVLASLRQCAFFQNDYSDT